MGYRIGHPSNLGIPLDTEVPQELQHRVHEVLSESVGLQQMEEQQVGRLLAPGIEDGGIRNRDTPLNSDVHDPGAISREVVESAWAG